MRKNGRCGQCGVYLQHRVSERESVVVFSCSCSSSRFASLGSRSQFPSRRFHPVLASRSSRRHWIPHRGFVTLFIRLINSPSFPVSLPRAPSLQILTPTRHATPPARIKSVRDSFATSQRKKDELARLLVQTPVYLLKICNSSNLRRYSALQLPQQFSHPLLSQIARVSFFADE